MLSPIRVIVVVSLCTLALAQPTKPLTQKGACTQFMPAVVRIDAGADTVASGFIISQDGWILTAGHVVFDQHTGQQLSTILVRLPDRTTSFAHVFVDRESVIRDFALLKVDGKTNLPFLGLGSWAEIDPGSDVTIIGYPFSAGSDSSITTKFCLAGIIAATDTVSKDGVNIDAIYFQGPAVKGLSGGPIISRDTGHVIGIQSQKLAGISTALAATREHLIAGPAPGIKIETSFGGVPLEKTFLELINVLDRHLANGLGTATAIDDPKTALGKAQRGERRKNH